MRSTHRTARRPLAVAVACLTLVALAGPVAAAAKPKFQMPFACGERWEGSTRASHSPSSLSIDWNRDSSDEGSPVVASASGIVTSVINLGNSSYGLYIVVDHGGGWTSLHAHLLRSFVVVGQRVDQGQLIALLGNSGGSSGAHLHYEQRLDRIDQHAVFNAVRFAYNTWLSSRNCVDVPVTGDWNGDRASDLGVFRRQQAGGVFRKRMPDGSSVLTSFGRATDEPIVGDWNGNGQSDPGVFNRMTRTFTLSLPAGRRTTIQFGLATDVPLAGDWDGDGRTDVGVFRPSKAKFVLRSASGTYSTKVLGSVSSLPVVGDWDGDGRFEPGVYDPATTVFTLSMPGGAKKSVLFGTRTSLPVVGYWGYDAISDVGVWDTATSTFMKRLTANRSSSIRFGKLR